jgi:peptidylprolyl isomerase
MMRGRRQATGPALALALLLAVACGGCGGGDSSGDGADSSTAAGGKADSRMVTTDQPPPEPGDRIPAASGAEASRRPEARVYVPASPPRKLVVRDVIRGTGPVAEAGDELTVNFVAARSVNGEFFESSWEWKKPFDFRLAKDEVVLGWVNGLPGMREGGRRYLAIPGTEAARFGVPASPETEENALIYVVDLIEVE